jgi:hypothetical protein
MKGGVEHTIAAAVLLVRTGRHLVVLTLPVVCWLAGQTCPAQMLLAWAVHRGAALLATFGSAVHAREVSGVGALSGDLLDGSNQLLTDRC